MVSLGRANMPPSRVNTAIFIDQFIRPHTAGTGSFYALYTYELFEYCEGCGFTRNLSAVLLLLALCKLMKLNVCYHIK